MSSFEILEKKFIGQRLLLKKMCEWNEENKPYQGLRILQNIPLTLESVVKIHPLICGGASVDVRALSLLPPVKEAVELLADLNIKMITQPDAKERYDFHLDCCAELIHFMPPKIGAVELTKTGGMIYRSTSIEYPMISVDDSPLKFLETYFGTGDGFVRAIRETITKEIYGKKFVVFGYGKVGSGIIGSLLKFTDNIVVIDIDDKSQNSASQKGLKLVNGTNTELVKEAIKDSFCVVTATGMKGLLTDYYNFSEDDFGSSLLANMGAHDEYGSNFSEDRVLFSKKTFNFSIGSSTDMKYLDPVFYAHNYSIDLILSKKMESGYNAFPKKDALRILEEWSFLYGTDISDLKKLSTIKKD